MPKTNFCNPDKNVKNQEKFNNAQNTYLDVEKELKNKKFIQLYDNANEYILQLMETDTTASRVFLFLARWAESNNTIDVTIEELTKILNISDKTARRATKTLEEYNFLTKIKVGKRNIYFLNPQICYNNIAEYKQKLNKAYIEYAGSSTVKMEIQENIINEEEITKFKNRDKLTYRVKLETKEIQEPTLDEQLEEYENKKLLDKDIKEQEKELKAIHQAIEMAKIELKNINKLKEEHQEQQITEEEIFQAEFFMDFEDSLDVF